MRGAGAILAGGHTIRDDEPKYGLAVVGTVHPDGIWPKSGARPGDALFLTKPLGTGLVLQAQRDGRAPEGALAAAVAAMRTLNRDAADALRPFAPNAVTDVTGFGLLGHAYEMASRSGVRIELDAAIAARAALGARARRGRRPHRRRPPEPRLLGAARREHGRRRRRGARIRSPDGRRPARLAARRQGGRARWRRSRARSRPLTGSVASWTARASRSVAGMEIGSDGVDGVTKKARERGGAVSARRFLQLAAAAVFTLCVVVTIGSCRPADGVGARLRPLAALRRQALSGEGRRTRSSSSATASSRSSGSLLTLVVWLAARRVDGLPRWVRRSRSPPPSARSRRSRSAASR